MNSMRCALSVAVVSSLLFASACKKDEARAGTPPLAPETPTAAEPDQGAAATPTQNGSDQAGHVVALGSGGKAKVAAVGGKTIADTPTYKLLLGAPPKVSKGADASVTLEVVPKPGWKLNKEFPTKLTIVPPAGVKVKKPEQTVADAVAFAEKAAHWSVDFQADSAGGKDFTGTFKFAVCTDTSCDPKKEQLAFNVAVAD
jgi:hypothetical protein